MSDKAAQYCTILHPLVPDWEIKPITVECLLDLGFIPHERYENTWVLILAGDARIQVNRDYDTGKFSFIYTNSKRYPIVGLPFRLCGQLYNFITIHPSPINKMPV